METLVDSGSLVPCVFSLLLQPRQYHSGVKGTAWCHLISEMAWSLGQPENGGGLVPSRGGGMVSSSGKLVGCGQHRTHPI